MTLALSVVARSAFEEWSPIVSFGVTVIGLIVFNWKSTATKRNLRELAERLGFETTPGLRVPILERTTGVRRAIRAKSKGMETGIEGEFHGKKFHFAGFKTGGGEFSDDWSEIAVAVPAEGLRFCLKSRKFAHKFPKFLNEREIKTLDEGFDHNWQIETNKPDVVLAMLGPELRALLLPLAPGSNAAFVLEKNWLRYQVEGGLTSKAVVAHLEGMLLLLCDLADAAEVAAGKCVADPPAPTK